MPKVKSQSVFNSVIWVSGALIKVKRSRRQGLCVAVDEYGDTYVYQASKWCLYEPEPKVKLTFKPVGEQMFTPAGQRPFSVNYGVSRKDPDRDKVHTFMQQEMTGDWYEYRLIGGRVRLVRVYQYIPPKVLSPKDPARFRSGAKGSRAKAAI